MVVASEGSDGIVPTVQINLQSLQLSLGKEKPVCFNVLWGVLPHFILFYFFKRRESVD